MIAKSPEVTANKKNNNVKKIAPKVNRIFLLMFIQNYAREPLNVEDY